MCSEWYEFKLFITTCVMKQVKNVVKNGFNHFKSCMKFSASLIPTKIHTGLVCCNIILPLSLAFPLFQWLVNIEKNKKIVGGIRLPFFQLQKYWLLCSYWVNDIR